MGDGVPERHRRWSADGIWDRVFAAVLAEPDAEGRIDRSMMSIDSASCPAPQHAAGARKRAYVFHGTVAVASIRLWLRPWPPPELWPFLSDHLADQMKMAATWSPAR